jgi:ABC-type antimicrobial peptide transport system permease subunit
VFYISYIAAELRRRKGRTLLTALGLAVGVGLVVTVNALSAGLDDAQDEVLKPLTGIGTDMSVTRPLKLSGSGFGGLSQKERDQLRKENGPVRIGLANRGKAGTHFEDDNFVATGQLSMPQSQVAKIAALDGAKDAAGGLTLTALHIEGTVPKQTDQPQVQQFGPQSAGANPGPPRNIDAQPMTVTGVDASKSTLGAISPSQITTGSFLHDDSKREAVLNTSYARRKNLHVGDALKLKGKKFEVVGLARTPLGGQAADMYVKLGQLQTLSGRKGRVNTVYVRATDTDAVSALATSIRHGVTGAQVTTAQDLADRIGGSLKDTKDLTGKLGKALVIVGLVAAFLIASLLTLSSVTKRIRELGTLKALGWRQWQVVRQVTGESLAQSILGGALGAALGIAGAALITAIAPELEASVAGSGGAGPNANAGPGPGGGPGLLLGSFGQGQIASGTTHVALSAPVGMQLVLLAIALALAGGLIAGAVGGLRAARLRPADALRHID